MKAFSSLAAVVALWLGVSFSIWLLYRLVRRRDGSRQRRLTAEALALIDEGAAVFHALRSRASDAGAVVGFDWQPKSPRDILQDDVRNLLNSIEAQSTYFDRVKTAKKKIENNFSVPDFQPLSEILQIRRDFWAASEIFLIDDIRSLGAELAEVQTYESFRGEALALLFKGDAAGDEESDPVRLRLSIAREEAASFGAHIEEAVAAELEKSRFPTPAEIVAVPLTVIRAAAFIAREGRTVFSDAAVAAKGFVRLVGSRGLKAAAVELRKARGDLPGQFATAFERAGGLARKGGEGLKRHYEFVLEAQELRARYAELLAHAPIVTEKGKQFLARLELERRAEQFRETSGGVADWARRGIVSGIAYIIAGLQYIQAKVTPLENKQLAVVSGATAASGASAGGESFRVLLLPASSYREGHHGRGAKRTKKARRAGAEPDYETPPQPRPKRANARAAAGGDAAVFDDGAAVANAPRAKVSRMAEGASLMDRLSTIEHEETARPQDDPSSQEEPQAKSRRFRVFGGK
jgi:hypothetical protein